MKIIWLSIFISYLKLSNTVNTVSFLEEIGVHDGVFENYMADTFIPYSIEKPTDLRELTKILKKAK